MTPDPKNYNSWREYAQALNTVLNEAEVSGALSGEFRDALNVPNNLLILDLGSDVVVGSTWTDMNQWQEYLNIDSAAYLSSSTNIVLKEPGTYRIDLDFALEGDASSGSAFGCRALKSNSVSQGEWFSHVDLTAGPGVDGFHTFHITHYQKVERLEAPFTFKYQLRDFSGSSASLAGDASYTEFRTKAHIVKVVNRE